MPGFVPRKPLGNNKTTQEPFNNNNPLGSPYDRQHGQYKKGAMGPLGITGTGGSNIVSVPTDQLVADNRHQLNGKFIKKARIDTSKNHSN